MKWMLVAFLMVGFHLQSTAVAESRGTVFGKLSVVDQKLNDAVWEGDVQAVANSLKEGANPDAVLKARFLSAKKSTPVLLAAAYHAKLEIEVRMKIVRLLLEHGANIDATDEGGFTALHGAVSKQGHGVLVSLLLEYGADVNAKRASDQYITGSIYDYTPLHQAIYPEDMEVLEILVDHGADVNAVAKGSSASGTPLMAAVRMTRVNAAKFLLKHGADINKATDGCMTPLHVALSIPPYWKSWSPEHTDIIKLLLQYKAATNIENRYGRTALEEAHVTKEAKYGSKQKYIEEMDTPIKLLKAHMSSQEKLPRVKCGS